MYCAKCGKENNENTNFCDFCGNELTPIHGGSSQSVQSTVKPKPQPSGNIIIQQASTEKRDKPKGVAIGVALIVALVFAISFAVSNKASRKATQESSDSSLAQAEEIASFNGGSYGSEFTFESIPQVTALECFSYTKENEYGVKAVYDYYCNGDEIVNITQTLTSSTQNTNKDDIDEYLETVEENKKKYAYYDCVTYTVQTNDTEIIEKLEIKNVTDNIAVLQESGLILDTGNVSIVSMKETEFDLLKAGFTKK